MSFAKIAFRLTPCLLGLACANFAAGQEIVGGQVVREVVQAPQQEDCHSCYQHQAPLRRWWWDHMLPRLKATHWGYQEYFWAEPLGAPIYGAFNTNVRNAQLAQLFLYQYDFQNDAREDRSKLNRFGRQRLSKLAPLFEEVAAPLRIEATHEADLDLARRQEVAAQLQALLGAPVALERIVLADTLHQGLRGEEAIEIHQNMIQQTRQGPRAGSTGRGTGSGVFLPSFGVGQSGGGSGRR